MATPFLMPKVEMTQESATIVQWRKNEGDIVEKGEPVLVVETDKVTFDIEAPASGILAGVRATPGQQVKVTELIAYILEPGESLPTEAGPQQAASATPVAQRLAAAHGLDLSTVSGTGPGGRITRADVEAVLQRVQGEPTRSAVRATPAARRLARERGVDLAAVPGTGPRGRVQAVDVPVSTSTRAESVEKVIPLAGMRRTIAERMTQSYQSTPHIALTTRVDMSRFEEARARLNAWAQVQGGAHVSVTAMLLMVVARTLKRHPWLNSSLREDGIHLLSEINIGVAVALPEGLIVPVVQQADRKSLAQIAAEVRDLTSRAREGRLLPADVAGGTFTVSNLGPFGVEEFTAIINPRQTAILAVGATRKGITVTADDQMVVRPLMAMTLCVDHRVVDGAVAARFLADLAEAVHDPALLLW